MYEVQAVCDRVLFLSRRRIVLEGDQTLQGTRRGQS
jgi:ABC-type Na+ transport system ATPase subunit NatA